MLLVANANVLFSFFNSKSRAREIVLLEDVKLFSPDFLLKEIERHGGEIREKFGLNERQFTLTLELLKTAVDLVPLREFEEFVEDAKKTSPDEYDVPYFALAMKLGIGIWSNDKALKKQSKVNVFSTEDLSKLFSELK